MQFCLVHLIKISGPDRDGYRNSQFSNSVMHMILHWNLFPLGRTQSNNNWVKEVKISALINYSSHSTLLAAFTSIIFITHQIYSLMEFLQNTDPDRHCCDRSDDLYPIVPASMQMQFHYWAPPCASTQRHTEVTSWT